MNKFFEKLDQKYLKICIYASVTVIATVVILFLLRSSGGFWQTLWTIFTSVLTPVLIGFIICYLFLPIVNIIEKLLSKKPTPWRRPVAVAIFYIAVFLLIGAAVIGLFFALKGGIDSLAELDYKSIQEFLLSLHNKFKDVMTSIEAQISESGLPFNEFGKVLSAVVTGITAFFSSLMFGIIFSIYFMIDETNIRNYWGRVILVISGKKNNESLKKFASEVDGVFSGYLRGQFTDALIVGAMTTVTFMIAGIPYAPVIGLLVGLGNLIPYVGPFVGYASIVVFCLISGAFPKMLLGIVLMFIIMFIDGNIINPRLLSANVEVHPLLVIAALIAGGAIGGFLGMVIAVPVAALVKMYFDRLIDYREQSTETEGAAKEESTPKKSAPKKSKQPKRSK